MGFSINPMVYFALHGVQLLLTNESDFPSELIPHLKTTKTMFPFIRSVYETRKTKP